MARKLKVIYEEGVLKPLGTLRGVSEHQVLDITYETDSSVQDTKNGSGEVVQLEGVLKDHPLGDISSDLKEMRSQVWQHVDTESADE